MPLQDVDVGRAVLLRDPHQDRPARRRRLVRHYERLRGTQPGHVPLVWLRTGGFRAQRGRVGFVVTPQFVACGSRPADSTVKPDTSTGAIIDDEIDLD